MLCWTHSQLFQQSRNGLVLGRPGGIRPDPVLRDLKQLCSLEDNNTASCSVWFNDLTTLVSFIFNHVAELLWGVYLRADVWEDGGQSCGLVQQGPGLFHRLPPLPQPRPGEDTRQAGRLLLKLRQTGLSLVSLVLTGLQALHNNRQLSDGNSRWKENHNQFSLQIQVITDCKNTWIQYNVCDVVWKFCLDLILIAVFHYWGQKIQIFEGKKLQTWWFFRIRI